MAAKKTKKVELEPEVMAEEVVEPVEEPKEVEEPKAPKRAKAPKVDDKVTIMIPLIDGEEPEITVGINGKYTKIRRGVEVEVPWNVAQVVKRSNYQMMAALKTQEKFKNQEFEW